MSEPRSGLAKLDYLRILQECEGGPALSFNRPPSAAATIPVTLLHPIFGQFVDDCAKCVPTPDDNNLVLELSYEMSKFYEKESDRGSMFIDILSEHGIRLSNSDFDRAAHTAKVKVRHEDIYYVVGDTGNEYFGGADPLLRAVSHYVYSVKKLSEDDVDARLPCLLIYMFGK
jgi:hypothetical protein